MLAGVALLILLIVLIVSAVILVNSQTVNTPEENAGIRTEAIKERSHEKCDLIRGEAYSSNPQNLQEPLPLPEEKARASCHVIVDWWLERDLLN